MKSSKLIGIPVSNGKTQYYINQTYVKFVSEAGFIPVLILQEQPPEEVAKLVDGLLLPGGIDIDPIFYGEDNVSSYSTEPEKDEFERVVFHAVRALGKPIFGICRGFQLIVREYLEHDLAVSEFFEFCQHISSHNQVSDQTLPRTNYQHFIEFDPKALYGKATTKIDTIPVNSMHHQGLVLDLKDKSKIEERGFKVAGWTDRGLKPKKDSKLVVCEAFRILKWGSPILAVQWHPEELGDYELIYNFFNDSKTVDEEKPLLSISKEP